jgi:DedD protein
MDPALKQRLIGATVLVVLAVIFVPMLVDDAPRGDSEAIDLTIPPQPSQAFETQVVPLGAQPAPAAADPDHVATVDTQAAPRVDALEGAEPATAPQPEPPTSAQGLADAELSSASDAPAQPAPAPTPVPPAAPPAAPPVAAASAPETAPATAVSTPPAAPALPRVAPGGRYLVHFGSYAKVENAQALAAELARAGIRAETERVTVEGKTALRVRSGPYADRTSAERVREAARRVRADVPSSLVEADTTPSREAADPVADGRVTGWAVQVGALAEAADANALRDRLRGGGFTAYVETLRTERGTLYRVRVGPEIRRADAERLRDTLKARFDLAGQVVAHP